MLKTFSTITGTGTYVSPAIDVSHVKTKRVICTSPMGPNSINPWVEDESDELGC